MKPSLKRSERPGLGVHRVVGDLIGEAVAGEGPEDGVEHVHGLRTTIKRLRAYLQLVRSNLEDAYYLERNAALRDSAQGLAHFRDRAVILQTADDLLEGARKPGLREALQAMRSFLDGVLPAGGGADTVRRAAQDAEATLQAMAASFEGQALEASGWQVLQGGLRRTYRKARRLMRRWHESGLIADAHEWRKFSKYLMFQIQLVEKAWPDQLRKLRKRLSRLETYLGKAHDLDMLEAAFMAMAPECDMDTDACRMVRNAMARRRKFLVRQAGKLGGRIFDDPPKDFVDEIRKRWRRWNRTGRGAAGNKRGGAGKKRTGAPSGGGERAA